jgi:hypothetical protein
LVYRFLDSDTFDFIPVHIYDFQGIELPGGQAGQLYEKRRSRHPGLFSLQEGYEEHKQTYQDL